MFVFMSGYSMFIVVSCPRVTFTFPSSAPNPPMGVVAWAHVRACVCIAKLTVNCVYGVFVFGFMSACFDIFIFEVNVKSVYCGSIMFFMSACIIVIAELSVKPVCGMIISGFLSARRVSSAAATAKACFQP